MKTSYFLIAILVIAFILVDFKHFVVTPPNDTTMDTIVITIPKGAGLDQIADTLETYNIISNKFLFKSWATLTGAERKLRAGYFSVPKDMNPMQAVDFLKSAKSKNVMVTLIEGWSTDQIATELESRIQISSQKFDSLCQDSAYIRSFGIKVDNLLGYLIPDTYAFYWGMDEKNLIRQLVTRTLKIFEADSVKDALNELKMTRDQVLTLASIVEGEVIYDDERATVASVYLNRLRKGMPLQADPTIQFIIDGPPRRLLLKDLEIDSPYNTYKYYGLPPGPINNPGIKSIMASIFAEKTNYLYFVANGDGRHTFSTNLREHNIAKRAFNKIRREVNRRKR
jgi:UPF0755 protein